MISHAMVQIRQYCDCGLLLTPQGVWYYNDVEDLIAAYEASNEDTKRVNAL